jgi:hypothetical protein
VPKVGFEPTRAIAHYALNVARLPFRHFGAGYLVYIVPRPWVSISSLWAQAASCYIAGAPR